MRTLATWLRSETPLGSSDVLLLGFMLWAVREKLMDGSFSWLNLAAIGVVLYCAWSRHAEGESASG